MKKKVLAFCCAVAMPAVAGCTPGTYDPSAYHHQDASTGSMLSGADTGTERDTGLADPSLRNLGNSNGAGTH